jgi:hypothetical protein
LYFQTNPRVHMIEPIYRTQTNTDVALANENLIVF